MSCSPFDLQDYFLQELAPPQRLQVEAHIKTCAPCRVELERLCLTQTALFSLRDEEIPQRIAFVSDPVFEPSVWRRAWTAFWNSGARLGFASAAMLSAALIVSALNRPAPAPAVQMAPPVVRAVSVSEADIQARVDTAVAKAVAEVEARQQRQTRQILADLEESRRRLLVAADEFDYVNKRDGATMISAGLVGPPQFRGTGDMK
jgi:anti-sigma factor RsiW